MNNSSKAKRTLPRIKSSVTATIVKGIPKTVSGRGAFLRKRLEKYGDRRFLNKDLGKYIVVLPKSIGETAYHAAKSPVSTIMALDLPRIIRKSVVTKTGLPPKANNQRRKFKFVEIKILECRIDIFGTAKLTVGKRKGGQLYEYCITKLIINEKREPSS